MKESSTASSSAGINIEIEYLRAVAVVVVILAHAERLFPNLGWGQWTGVDLFFCISGYVIARSFEPYFDQHIAEGRWWTAARAFWVRRMFRLAPLAWLWLAVMVLCSFYFNQTGWFGKPSESLKTAGYFLMFITNFAMATGSVTTNGFLWSLTLEDQFYFVFPFLLLLVRGQWRWKLLFLLIFLQFLPFRSLGGAPYPSLLWLTRLDALMWGILIYKFSRSATYWQFEPAFCRNRFVALALNAVLIYAIIQIPKGVFGRWLGYQFESQIALASAALVFLASYDRGYVLPLPSWVKTIMAWIGNRSYGLYLIHIPVFGILVEIWVRYSYILGSNKPDARYFYAFGTLILLPLVAELNFRYVETPLRRVGVRWAKQILNKPASEPAKITADAAAAISPSRVA